MKEDKIVVKAPIKIEDGKHSGTIVNVARNLPNEKEGRIFDYIDLSIKLTDDEREPEIKVGFPTNISELSALGRTLKKAGMEFTEGDEITIKSIKEQLENRNITFLTKNEKTEYGEFANILKYTIEFE
jgi:hypothetical protein